MWRHNTGTLTGGMQSGHCDCAVRKRAKAEQAKKAEAIAHDGRVTGILPTPDGLHWLTAGTDNRLRLWDAQHKYHLLVNYPQTFNSSMKVSAYKLSVSCISCAWWNCK